MADIIIDLAGRGGLADGYAGDSHETTPQVNLITNVQEGQLASGFYNPEIKIGYLHPGASPSASLSFGSTPSTEFATATYDKTNNLVFAASRDTKLFIGDGLADASFALKRELGTGAVFNDLEVYEKNTETSLYYTYTSSSVTIANSLSSSSGLYDWLALGVSIAPYSTDRPVVLSKEQYVGSGTFTEEVTVPAGYSNTYILIFLESEFTGWFPSAYIKPLPSGSQTQIIRYHKYDDVPAGDAARCIEFYKEAAAAGTYEIEIRGGATETRIFVLVVSNLVDGVGAGAVTSELFSGLTPTAITRIDAGTSSKNLNLTFITSYQPAHAISSTTDGGSYDATAQTGNNGTSVKFDGSGTKMFVLGRVSGNATTGVIHKYNLTTPWDISTGVSYANDSLLVTAYNPTPMTPFFIDSGLKHIFTFWSTTINHWKTETPGDISAASYIEQATITHPLLDYIIGSTINSTGTKIYAFGNLYYHGLCLLEYDLATAWDLSTMAFVQFVEVPNWYAPGAGPLGFKDLVLGRNDTILYGFDQSYETGVYAFRFDPLYPGDISKLDVEIRSELYLAGSSPAQSGGFISFEDSSLFYRTASDSIIRKRNFPLKDVAAIGSEQQTFMERQSTSRHNKLILNYGGRDLECGVADIPGFFEADDNWLSEVQGLNQLVSSDYNFLRKADNGFLYLFAGNRVHRIDGGVTGGSNATLTKDVLKFPDYFTITDAVDYRSQMYLAVHHYPVTTSVVGANNFAGTCGIVVWGRSSVQLGGIDWIELPGIREIKKIYKSPDGMLKLITVGDNGITELRRFGYNDSGGVVFPIIKKMGRNAFPQYPDGLTTAGDKVVWLANDATLYQERENAVTKISTVKSGGTVAAGAVVYGSATSAQDVKVFYKDGSTVAGRRIEPWGYPPVQQGDVYTGVYFIPITSKVLRVRIYNAPLAVSGTDVIATVKLYFNQSTSATMPNGMTKSITQNEAKRGYVDFNISKPYIHAIQLEVEWATDVEPDELYLPSVAVINTEETDTKTPDNG